MTGPVIIIPARLDSSRLPRKVLLEVQGKTLLERVYANANRATEWVYVATPDPEIVAFCEDKGMQCITTSAEHPNGTCRCAEAAREVVHANDPSPIINVQADEVDIQPEEIHQLSEVAWEHPVKHPITTLVFPIELDNSSETVRAVVGENAPGRCLWFTRHDLPAARYGHVGIYAFANVQVLQEVDGPPSPLSQVESLEQLTWLEEGWDIAGIAIDRAPLSINTPADLKRAWEVLSP